MKTAFIVRLFTALLLLAAVCTVQAQSTAFTYQGRLSDNGAPANGLYDMQFNVFGVATSGSAMTGAVVAEDVAVTNGLFTVTLDFGSAAFDGNERWLEIGVRTGASTGAFTILTPRQKITAAPYAIRAASVSGPVAASQLTGTVAATNLASGAAAANLAASGQVGVASGGVVLSPTENAALVNVGYVKMGAIPASTFDNWRIRNSSPVMNSSYGYSFNGNVMVWTGDGIIWWGATDTYGAWCQRYDAATDTWSGLSTNGAPYKSYNNNGSAVVWTGSEMIIWGGYGSSSVLCIDGARYNLGADTWSALNTIGAPLARSMPSAVWTGSEMIVWGGESANRATNVTENTTNVFNAPFNDGGRYNPATDTWTALSTNGAPSARYWHSAVWTGSEMIIWGGFNGYACPPDGGRYNPATDTWTTLNTIGAPSARIYHSTVWTGSEMIVWGGWTTKLTPPYGYAWTITYGGGRYNPVSNTWTPMNNTGAPSSRGDHRAVWTGNEMIVWGGNDGGNSGLTDGSRYDPTANTWAAMNYAPFVIYGTAVWTGSEMIIFGRDTYSQYYARIQVLGYTPGKAMILYQKP